MSAVRFGCSLLTACEVIEVIKARGKMIEIAGEIRIINVSWRAIED